MDQFRGRLSKGDRVICEDAEGHIGQVGGPIGGWEGYLFLPSEVIGFVNTREGFYRLDIEGGMSLNINIDRIRPTDGVVHFKSSGAPLDGG